METIIGTWKIKSLLMPGEHGPEAVKPDDPELERMRFLFEDNGIVYEGIECPKKLTKKDKEYMEKQGMILQDGVICMKKKKWFFKDGKLYSEISAVVESENSIKECGPVEIEGEYLKVFAVFTYYLLERV